MMNGISFDGKDTIAVSDTLDRSIKLFRIKSKTSELELFQQLPIDMLPDNISYDSVN